MDPAADADADAEPAPDDLRRLGRADRLARIVERDGARCVWCGVEFDRRRVWATTEHLVPRVRGGPSRIENEVAACASCNARRGHADLVTWIEECEARGWSPDRSAVVRTLRALQDAIDAEGGHRKARAPLRRALRRLDP